MTPKARSVPPRKKTCAPQFLSDAVPLYYQLASLLREKIITYYRSDIYSFTVHLTRNPKQVKAGASGWAFKDRNGTPK